MITPIEIQSKSFKSGGLGYDKKDVDGFMKDVLKSYETLYRENMELNDKIAVLTDGIQYYKTIEKTLQKALVLAEKTAEDTKAAAIKNAKNIENEALTKSQVIMADAKNELERIHNQTIQLIQQYEKYKAQFKNLAAAQIEVLESDSFSINVARLDAFIPNMGENETTRRNKKAYNIDLKKVANESKHSRNIEKGQKKSEAYHSSLEEIENEDEDMDNYKSSYSGTYQEEASATKERTNLDELIDNDGFEFLNLED